VKGSVFKFCETCPDKSGCEAHGCLKTAMTKTQMARAKWSKVRSFFSHAIIAPVISRAVVSHLFAHKRVKR